jgi:hypothetical protein
MKLEDINKDNIFKVPDHYFEEFPDRLQKRIAEKEENKPTPVFQLRRIVQLAAAAVILFFAIYGINQLNNRPASIDQILSDISTEELINYLVESDMSTEELLEDLDISIIASNEDPISDEVMPSESINEEIIDEILDEYEIEMQYL